MKESNLYELKEEILIVRLPEELDHHTAGVIRQQTDGYFYGRRIRDVIFDYRNTHFMDSSGIGLIMGRYREVRYLNGNVYIVGVNDRIKRILDISGLYKVAKKANDIDTAMKLIDKNR